MRLRIRFAILPTILIQRKIVRSCQDNKSKRRGPKNERVDRDWPDHCPELPVHRERDQEQEEPCAPKQRQCNASTDLRSLDGRHGEAP